MWSCGPFPSFAPPSSIHPSEGLLSLKKTTQALALKGRYTARDFHFSQPPPLLTDPCFFVALCSLTPSPRPPPPAPPPPPFIHVWMQNSVSTGVHFGPFFSPNKSNHSTLYLQVFYPHHLPPHDALLSSQPPPPHPSPAAEERAERDEIKEERNKQRGCQKKKRPRTANRRRRIDLRNCKWVWGRADGEMDGLDKNGCGAARRGAWSG